MVTSRPSAAGGGCGRGSISGVVFFVERRLRTELGLIDRKNHPSTLYIIPCEIIVVVRQDGQILL